MLFMICFNLTHRYETVLTYTAFFIIPPPNLTCHRASKVGKRKHRAANGKFSYNPKALFHQLQSLAAGLINRSGKRLGAAR
jgi:hypothetical protein